VYIKAQALGNDFLLKPVDRLPRASDVADEARAVCDRHRGIGADGLMFVEQTAGGANSQLINADGGPAEVSGNGVRCVAAWLAAEARLAPGASVVVHTAAGPKRLTLLEAAGPRFTFRAAMGQPEAPREVTLDVGGESVRAIVLGMGNPQCVVLGPISEARLHGLGGAIATHRSFPAGTNVEFVQVSAPDHLDILIWERGVGPTEASGTGACAAAVAAAAFGGATRRVRVASPGGVQDVEWTAEGVWLTGWAELVARVTPWPGAGGSRP
jgi:diaminopimelate epimerase